MRIAILLALAFVAGCSNPEPDERGDPKLTSAEGKVRAEAPSSWGIPLMVGQRPVRARLATTRAEHYEGFAKVSTLAPDQGMLFVYAKEEQRSFWMKGCLVDLDIAFLDANGRVFDLHSLRAPVAGQSDELLPRAVSSKPARLVLELPLGWFKKHGLGVGTQVVLPPDLYGTEAK